jgi:hypothetical protein
MKFVGSMVGGANATLPIRGGFRKEVGAELNLKA